MNTHNRKYFNKLFKYFFFFMTFITQVMAIPEIKPATNILLFYRLTLLFFSNISLSE